MCGIEYIVEAHPNGENVFKKSTICIFCMYTLALYMYYDRVYTKFQEISAHFVHNLYIMNFDTFKLIIHGLCT